MDTDKEAAGKGAADPAKAGKDPAGKGAKAGGKAAGAESAAADKDGADKSSGDPAKAGTRASQGALVKESIQMDGRSYAPGARLPVATDAAVLKRLEELGHI